MVFKTKRAFESPGSLQMPAGTPLSERVRQVPARASSGVPSIISAEMTIHGDFHSGGDLQVEGTVVGEIEVATLVIADGASISGNIVARDVRVCGAVNGTIRAQMVTLTATARVCGDIYHELIAIETGGLLDGQSRRLPQPMADSESEPEHEAAPEGQNNDHPPEGYSNGHDNQHHDHQHHEHHDHHH